MPSKRAVSTAERCPNCNAFLPAAEKDETVKRCEYCGIELEVPPAPAPPTPNASPSPLPRASTPSRGGTGWSLFVVPIFLTGSILWFTQWRGHPERVPDVVSLLRRSPAVRADGEQTRKIKNSSTEIGGASGDPLSAPQDQTSGTKPRRHDYDAADAKRLDPCHVSGMQMSAVVAANQVRAKKCFESELARYPADVGLTSDWEIELDGNGKVYTAKGRLHLLDWKRAAEARAQQPLSLPGASALSCMEGIVKGWSFPAYSPKDGGRLRMKCSFNFVLKDL